MKKIKTNINKNISKSISSSNIKPISIIKCPHCNGESIIKSGITYHKQRYYCKECKKDFCEKDDRVKRPPEQRELCLRLYANNMPMRRIQRIIEETFDTKISFNLIDTWIKSSVKRLKEDMAKEKESNKENNKKNNKEEKESNKGRKDNINDNKNTINILEMDELYTHYYDSKKN